MKTPSLIVALLWLITGTSACGFDLENPLAGLKNEHPRLLFTAADQSRIEQLAQTDELLARLIQQNRVNAEQMLADSRVRYEIPDGKRLLKQSRKCVERVVALSMEYRLSGDARFAQCAIEEMLTAAQFKDWNPSHFLDVGEMTAALAIGYDWLHDAMTPDQREAIETAIVELGLQAGLRHYETKYWWTRKDNNWNQVCNGGMILGALAIGNQQPELAKQIMQYALKSTEHGLSVYDPDGAYPEGPGYWKYGTVYTSLTIASLQTALGHDFDMHKTPGLDRTCDFRMHTISPLGSYFNYADCSAGAGITPAVFQLAKTFDRPRYSWAHRARLNEAVAASGEIEPSKQDRYFPLEIVFYDPRGSDPSSEQLPLDSFFPSQQDIVTMRSAWGDNQAAYVGFKGGDNQASHGHLDIGSFVYDWGGVRWALELGGDNYNMPGYFRANRWKYFRLINAGHNTLVINGLNQNDPAIAKITTFASAAKTPRAVADMTDAYRGQAKSVKRGVALIDRRALQITDEITGLDGEVRWGMITTAEIKLQGNTAILTESGKRLRAEILEPADARFTIKSTKPPTDIENPNEGTAMLAVNIQRQGDMRMIILLRPDDGTEVGALLEPLADWGE
jgi:hypothetical protein